MKKSIYQFAFSCLILLAAPIASAQIIENFHITDIYYTCCTGVNNLAATHNRVFFRNEGELWSVNTNGENALVRDINPYGDSNPGNFTPIGNVLYFTASDGVNGNELWRSDGTYHGTYMVKNINPVSYGGSFPLSITVVNNLIYFSANNGNNGRELWRSDGTFNGTFMVADINPGTRNADPYQMTELNGIIYFGATRYDIGTEVWQYNPAARTLSYYNLRTGAVSSYPGDFTALNNKIYFSADYAAYGRELFQYNPGTRGLYLYDINRGSTGSDAANFVKDGNKLYLAASTADRGREIIVFNTLYNEWNVVDATPQVLLSEPPIPVSTNPLLYGAIRNELYFTQNGTGLLSIYGGDIIASAIARDGLELLMLDNPTYIGQSNQSIGVVAEQETRLFFNATTQYGEKLIIINSFGETNAVNIPGAVSVAIMNGALYVGDNRGFIYKLRPEYVSLQAEPVSGLAASDKGEGPDTQASLPLKVDRIFISNEEKASTLPVADVIPDTPGSTTASVQLNAFPNPVAAGSSFRINYNTEETGDGTIELFDVTGKLLSTQNETILRGFNQFTIPTGHLSPGTYIVRLVHNNALQTIKITVAGGR